MRTAKVIFTLLISLFVLACQEEDSLTPNPDYQAVPTQFLPSNFVSEMSAQLNDTVWDFNPVKGGTYGKFLSVVGYHGFDSLYLSTEEVKPGIYTSSSSGLNGIYYSANGKTYSSSYFNPANAQIRISKYDPATGLATGSFSGTIQSIGGGNDTIIVRRGTFSNVRVIKKHQIEVGSMSADIDNSHFESYFCVYKPNIQGSGTYAISGSNTGVTKSITMTFTDTIRQKTYTIGSSNEASISYIANLTAGSNPISDVYFGDSGQINISSIDTVRNIVKGTFNFTGSNANNVQVSVVNGKFEAATHNN